MEAHQESKRFKLIFLDFDGVLNSYRTVWAAPQGQNGWMPDHLDPVAIGLVRKLCELTGAKIVISSSWRRHFSINEIKDMLAKKGWPDAPIIDTTEVRIGGERYRGNEVAEWLEDFVEEGNEVDSYVILDDNNWFHTSGREQDEARLKEDGRTLGRFEKNQPHVKTDEMDGMTVENFYSALLLLDDKHPKLHQLDILLGYRSHS